MRTNTKLGTAALALLLATSGQAANAPLQDLFFAACVNPQANLAVRCAQTTGGLGDLSSDSESSLNPSQGLGSANGRRQALEDVVNGARDNLELAERVDSGPFSLVLNVVQSETEYDRRVDLDSERGQERDDQALDIGFDYRVSDRWVMGALVQMQRQEVTYERELAGLNFSPSGAAGTVDTDAMGLLVYVSRTLGASGYLDVSLSHTRSSQEFTRNALFQENTRTLAPVAVRTEGQTDGVENALHISTGLSITRGGWDVQPFASASVIRARVDDFTEADLSNSGLAMAFDMDANDTTLASLGARISRAFSFSGGVIVPSLRLQYTHPIDSEPATLNARYVNDLSGNSLNLSGTDFDEGYLDGALAVSFVLPGGWLPYLEVSATHGIEDMDRWRVSAGLRKEL